MLYSRDNDLHQALTATLGLWLSTSRCLHEQLLHSPKDVAVEGTCTEACSGGHEERAPWRNKCQNRMNNFVCYTRYKEVWYRVGANLSTDRIMPWPCLVLQKSRISST